MPMQEAGESQQPGPTRDSLIREADLNGFLGSLQFNEFGHCLVSRFVGCCCEIYHIPASFYQQWPKLLLHGYGLDAWEKERMIPRRASGPITESDSARRQPGQQARPAILRQTGHALNDAS